MDPWERTMPGTPNPESISTRLPRIADRVHDGVPVAQQTHDLTSRMRESRTSGSVGALGRQLPRATRLGRSRSSTRTPRARAGAATSLARYGADTDDPSAAARVLGPVYGRFNEGFETPHLTDARTLLAALGG